MRDRLRAMIFRVETPQGPIEFEPEGPLLVFDALERGASNDEIVRMLKAESISESAAQELVARVAEFRERTRSIPGPAENSADFRAEFAPLKARILRSNKRFTYLIVFTCAAALLAVLSRLIPPLGDTGLLALLLALFLPLPGAIVLACMSPRLRCPACRESLTPTPASFGKHCPTCGGPLLGSGTLLSPPVCPDCRVTCGYSRAGKTFVVRACTHCGAWLDDEGV